MEESLEMMTTMRAMAWQRAKGELRSMYATYWHHPQPGRCESETYEDFSAVVEDFITKVENKEAGN